MRTAAENIETKVSEAETKEPKEPIVETFIKSLSQGKQYDRSLEKLLSGYIGRKGSEVAEDVVNALYEPNGKGVPKFIEALAPYLHINTSKLSATDIDKFVAKYGIQKDALKRLVAGKEVFDAAVLSQVTTQLGTQLVTDFIDYIPAAIANEAYKNMASAKLKTIGLQRALAGEPAAKNLEVQLASVATPEQLQGIANGIVSDAYRTYKSATPNTLM